MPDTDEMLDRMNKLLAYDFGDESDYCIDVAVTLGEAKRRLSSLEEEKRVALDCLRSARSNVVAAKGMSALTDLDCAIEILSSLTPECNDDD